MSGSASLGVEQAMLSHTLGIGPVAAVSRAYIALCLATLVPDEQVRGVEVSGNGYARMAASFQVLASPPNMAANTTTVAFPTAAAPWGVLGYFELWDAPAGGNRLYWGALVDPADGTTPITLSVSAGDVLRFSAGALGVRIGPSGSSTVGGAFLPLVGGTLASPGNLTVGGTFNVTGAAAALGGPLSVTGPTVLAGGATITGESSIRLGNFSLAFDPTLPLHAATKQYVDGGGAGGGLGPFLPTTGGSLNGPGNLVVGGTLGVTGNATFSGTLGVTGNASTSGTSYIQAGGPIGTANVLRLSPAAPGANPSLTVLGPDTDRSILINPVGTGQLVTPRLNMAGQGGGGIGMVLSGGGGLNQVNSSFYAISFLTGSNSNVNNQHFNSLIVNDNVIYTGNGQSNALLIRQNAQANATRAGGLWVEAQQIAAPTNPFGFLTALTATGSLSYNCGGTALTVGSTGGAVATFNTYTRAFSGATYLTSVGGYELDIQALAGSSFGSKFGVLVQRLTNDAVSGAFGNDSGIVFGSTSGPVGGWDFAINLGGGVSNVAYKPTATLVVAREPQNPALGQALAAWGLDFRGVLFSGGFLRSIGYTVDGGGAVTNQRENISNWSLAPSAAGLSIDAPSQRASLTSIAAGGGAWAVGDKATTATGGVYQVTAISGGTGLGPATTVVQLVPDVSASPPVNPVAATATNATIFRTAGAGLTLNLAWTAANALSLQPSGGALRLPGIPASASYATDAAAAAGGVTVGQIYRNGSVLQVRVA